MTTMKRTLVGAVLTFSSWTTGCATLGEILAEGYRASWEVEHDHGDGWAYPCRGALYVRYNGVVGYDADDYAHRWEVTADQIEEAKKNAVVGASREAFHVRLYGGDNYNFAILSYDGQPVYPSDALYEINQAMVRARDAANPNPAIARGADRRSAVFVAESRSRRRNGHLTSNGVRESRHSTLVAAKRQP